MLSRYACIQGTLKESFGPVNHPLVFGGQLIHPGDVISGDCDSIGVTTAQEGLASAVTACRVREGGGNLPR